MKEYAVTVDTRGPVKQTVNFWNHVNFAPTDAIEDEWGQVILDRIAADKVAGCMRLYTMFEDMVTMDEQGRLVYDFTDTDVRLDYLTKKGFGILLTYFAMPLCLADDPQAVSEIPRYKNKTLCFSKPRDYRLWQEVCYTFTCHILERYGEDVVSTWYFACWNEPDHKFWMNNVSCVDVCQEKYDAYCTLYDHFATGVKRACSALKVGGPSAGCNLLFLETFAKHLARNENSATGQRGIPFDFFAMHTYAQYGRDRYPVEAKINAMHTYTDILRMYDVPVNEIVIDEWGARVDGQKTILESPVNILRETEMYAAMYAALIKKMSEEREKGYRVSRMFICLWGQHNPCFNFDGKRSFFTPDGIEKPIYNAYALCADLGTDYYPTADSDNLVSYVSKTADGYAALFTNYESDVTAVCEPVTVDFTLQNVTGPYTLQTGLIDDTHSNGYAHYKRLGEPKDFTPALIDELKTAARLYRTTESVTVQGAFNTRFTLGRNATILLTLTKR